MKIVRCADLAQRQDGRHVEVAGIILVRQRPGSANVTFITHRGRNRHRQRHLWQRRYETYRRVVHGASLMRVRGRLQKEGEVIHVIADELEDCSEMLALLDGKEFAHQRAPADGGSGGNTRLTRSAGPAERSGVRPADQKPRFSLSQGDASKCANKGRFGCWLGSKDGTLAATRKRQNRICAAAS